MPQFVNFDIIKNPFNWLIVLLMLIIFGIAADTLLSNFQTNGNN